ncbi:helix-turn-helix transcriptional regulator [Amycolatopsis cihanbeyliensis]|nr:helix-turn-helix transcriptional regulator [Amycolatopsis cihanbeyliensis]
MSEGFGQALRRLRQAAGLSQPELARRVPISQSSLSRYEWRTRGGWKT